MASATEPAWPLPKDLSLKTLQTRTGAKRIDARFLRYLRAQDPDLAARLVAARSEPEPTSTDEASREAELLIAVAGHLDTFLAALFGIEAQADALREAHRAQAPVQRTKYKFVKRQALLGVEPEQRATLDHASLLGRLQAWDADPFNETAFADTVLSWQETARKGDPEQKLAAREKLNVARDYSAWAAGTEAGRATHRDSVLFKHPQALDPYCRVALSASDAKADGLTEHRISLDKLRARSGFDLTDDGFSLAHGVDEARYCLACHRQGTDSCRHGIRKAVDDATPKTAPVFSQSTFGEALSGCPLEERISEFLWLKQTGHPIGALAMITVDNPMVAATGHRICNDCTKACVFQQQTPVDIPQAETRVLRDVLELPWGVELYGLLTRWNPLKLKDWLPGEKSTRRVLVVGCGPAGFSAAHELLRAGHQVVAIDGLKIEPGRDASQPVADLASMTQALSERVGGGFGGVAEYGITVRWNKNYLSLIRLLLERWPHFALFGGVRLGGQLSIADAWRLGFDHIALAVGAGRPTVLDIPGGLANGVRAASDFLMALQLTGAARQDSLANLELRLPVIVVGGGLTAIDTATEARAYYAVQVEKMLRRFEALAAANPALPPGESPALSTYLEHARALRRARADNPENSRLAEHALIDRWGGVTIAYRRRLVDSPAYRLNPEELEHALAEGIRVLTGVEPIAIETDAEDKVAAVVLRDSERQHHRLPAGSVLIAAGTHPNTVIAREEPGILQRDGEFLALVANQTSGRHAKDPNSGFFCFERDDGRAISILGDAHPAFAGNVVRAIASAKRAAPLIDANLRRLDAEPGDSRAWSAWRKRLSGDWCARVARVTELAPGIVEVVVRAPAAARRFEPGQFYRLQTYEAHSQQVSLHGMRTSLASEALAMTGAWVDRRRGELAMVVLEMGGTANLLRLLKANDPVVLMGPSGSPTEIGRQETVILIGGGLGNAVLFSIGAAMRQAGSRVIYIAGYRRSADRFHVDRIESAADCVIWCCDQAPGFTPNRPQDTAIVGSVVDALNQLSDGRIGPGNLQLADADRLLAIGSDNMMAAVAHAVGGPLAGNVKPGLKAFASINSPMQCMMKEICAQCLQRQVDPQTGRSRIVFSCAEQDQPLLAVEFRGLSTRLAQNRTQEILSAQWQAAVLQQLS